MRFTTISAITAAAVTSLALAATSGVTAQAAPSGPSEASESPVVAAAATSISFGTFNVRTARADRGTKRSWLKRAASVAREIESRNPGIVAIQELGPGRADGKKAKINGATRQTESLEKKLAAIGAGRYQLTRVTAYVAPGTTHGTQGARILYDTHRYRLISKCVETTGKSNYNSSCSMDLPVMKGDSKSKRRSAAYAEFEDRSTGKNFWVISVHLDTRHGKKEAAYDSLRASQVKAVYNRVAALANGKPILFGGDLNSWATKAGSNAPFNWLTGQGLHDATAAATQIDARYPTVNHWKKTLKANAPGRQVALDVILVKGASSFSSYENVMKVKDSSRPSDHNFVVSKMTL